ncbi:astacin [Cooperia oncophora]
MRLILLTLFLIAAVDGGIIDKVKGAFSGEGGFGQKLKNATIVGFKKLFENTALFKIRDKIRSMKDKVLKTLELTPKMMKSLEERLKRLRPIKKDKVAEKGDSITEVNEYSQVGKDLYQSDMVLTEEQAEEIVQDIEDEVAGENRAKRQAFKDHRYPNMLWSQGVNYYFHKLASREMRSAFEKGAKLWEQDTCINFTRNPFGEKTLKLIFLALDHNTRPFNNSESTIRRMRLILLTLFLIAAVDGGIVDKVKGVFSGDGSFGQKLKNATIVGFKKLFENTALFKIRDKIRSMKDKVLKTLELTPKMMKSLEERLKRLRPIKKDKVAEKGDSITEVNEYSQLKIELWYSQRMGVGLTSRKLSAATETVTGRGWLKPASIAAHELGHALGFFHTMSRHDRDDFITVNKHNIKVDWLSQFNKETTKTNDNYNMTYDYGSIMHYGGTRSVWKKNKPIFYFMTMTLQ